MNNGTNQASSALWINEAPLFLFQWGFSPYSPVVGSQEAELVVLIKKCDTLLHKCEVRRAVTQPDVEAQIRLNWAPFIIRIVFFLILKYIETVKSSRENTQQAPLILRLVD